MATKKKSAHCLQRSAPIILLLVTIFGGCHKTIRKANLVGTYLAEYSYGREELKLAADGSYTQSFTPKSKSANSVSNSGKWELHDDQLTLFDSLIIDDFYGDLSPTYAEKKSGANLLKVSSSFGRTTIRVNANTDEVYVKQ